MKLRELLSENSRTKVVDDFFKFTKQQLDGKLMNKYLNSLIKKGAKIPSKDLKDLKDIIKTYTKLDNDPRQKDEVDMHDWDYDITETEDDWFTALADLKDKGLI
jgi:hypothetical protein